jgi:large subunit ribosomal protein L9
VEVILRNDVEKVGLRGEVVTVADGYARNYLIPRRLAERATPARVAEVRRRDELRARQEARTVEQAREIAEVLAKTVLREVRAGPTGVLFGSVTAADVADEIWRVRKVRVDRRRIRLDEPLKRVGRYELPIEVFEDVDVVVKTLVVPEGGELPPEEEPARADEAPVQPPEVAELEPPPEEAPVPADEAPEPPPEVAELEPPPAEAAAQVPDDAFDRAAGEALEPEQH